MCSKLRKLILITLNVLLLLAGLGILIAGALLKWNRPLVESLINTALKQNGGSMNSASKEITDIAIGQIQALAGPVGDFLFYLGITLCCLTVLAFIGICCKITLALIIYTFLVGIIMLAHLLVIIIYFSKREILTVHIDNGFNTLMSKYISIASQSQESITLAILFPSLKCCGYNSADDFNKAGYNFSRQDTVSGVTVSNLQYPLACCMANMTGSSPTQCPRSFTCGNSFKCTGCKSRIEPLVDRIVLISVIPLIFEVFIFVLAVIHLCDKD